MGTTIESSWENARLAEENVKLRVALKKANEQAERFEREWYLRGDALEDWQKFAADVIPGCAAGADWLDGLRARTTELLTPNL